MNKNILNLNMPYSMDYLVIKNNKNNFIQIVFFDLNFFYKYCINLKKNQFSINKDTNTLVIKMDFINKNQILDYNLFLVKMLNFNSIFFVKIKFKGKGYKIKLYKKNKIMFFFFGRSHYSIIKFNKINLFKLGKYKFILSHYNLQLLKSVSKMILNIRRLNVFTIRGLKLSKQIVYKRKGKKSSSSY